jgi:hypothetical protein
VLAKNGRKKDKKKLFEEIKVSRTIEKSIIENPEKIGFNEIVRHG